MVSPEYEPFGAFDETQLLGQPSFKCGLRAPRAFPFGNNPEASCIDTLKMEGYDKFAFFIQVSLD